ncbi:MAG TPA: RNA polymerase sigma factor [Lachnospiraceae bacterium]|nr:RNA polymerase sigma factor [Lachnospiraceae bacterium]
MEEMAALAEKARRGDTEAFSQLYAGVYKDLYRFALYVLGHREDAEDAVADTVLAAYGQIASLRNAEAFRAWIFRILSNRCRRTLKTYVNKTEELDEELPDPRPDFTENDSLRAAFACLTEEERVIISLHIFGGYTSREIGKYLHMNDATVRSKESRALARLKNGEALL